MGGSASKSSVTKNATGIKKMNESLEKVMQEVLNKYSEMVKNEMGDYYQKLARTIREPGINLPQPPQMNVAQIFGKKCSEDLVAIFEKKLDKFPKYALEESSMFRTKLRPITMEISDFDSIRKQALCRNLSQLFVAFLDLLEQSVVALVSCQSSMNGMIMRLTQSGPTGAIAENKANREWFNKMTELQKAYIKQLKMVDKFFQKMNGITLLSDKQLNKLITEMQKINRANQQLPNKCNMLANELQTIQTIDERQAEECNRLKISPKNCNSNTIGLAIQKLEQEQMRATQQLTQRANRNPVTGLVQAQQQVPFQQGQEKRKRF